MASIDEIIGWVKGQYTAPPLNDFQKFEIETAVLAGHLVAYLVDEGTGTHHPATPREVSESLGNALGAIAPGKWVLICRNRDRDRDRKPDSE